MGGHSNARRDVKIHAPIGVWPQPKKVVGGSVEITEFPSGVGLDGKFEPPTPEEIIEAQKRIMEEAWRDKEMFKLACDQLATICMALVQMMKVQNGKDPVLIPPEILKVVKGAKIAIAEQRDGTTAVTFSEGQKTKDDPDVTIMDGGK